MGIVVSETVSSAQLKGAKTVVGDIRDSKVETDNDLEGVRVGDKGSVCVDIVAEEDWEMIGGFV
jgi:hypothetical protein